MTNGTWIFASLAVFAVLGCGDDDRSRPQLAPVGGSSLSKPSSSARRLPPVPPVPASWGVSMSQAAADAKRVLVIVNANSEDSKTVGAFYVKQRKIPHDNVLFVSTEAGEDLKEELYRTSFRDPVLAKLKTMKPKPDFIVLTKGVPIRTWESIALSVDSNLAVIEQKRTPIRGKERDEILNSVSPYYAKEEEFSSAKYGFYLVCRLDGYTVEDAKRLVTNSLAAKPANGPFLIDVAPDRIRSGYAQMHETLVRAAKVLRERNLDVELDETNTFVAGSKPCMGYASWGSNDGHYDVNNYRKIRFLPGAIAETFVSTSARTFKPVTGGQSVITDLIASGITGVKGYVDEPYTFALAHPDILFDRYTKGYTLAESFYMASPILKWKDIVVGDPICRPYPKR